MDIIKTLTTRLNPVAFFFMNWRAETQKKRNYTKINLKIVVPKTSALTMRGIS
jgi:hypothetical protein